MITGNVQRTRCSHQTHVQEIQLTDASGWSRLDSDPEQNSDARTESVSMGYIEPSDGKDPKGTRGPFDSLDQSGSSVEHAGSPPDEEPKS